MKLNLNCIACGHRLEFGDAYEEYEGEIKCWVCSAVLAVKIQDGRLKSMKFLGSTRSSSLSEALEQNIQ